MAELKEIFERLGRVERTLSLLYNPEANDGIIIRIEKSLNNYLSVHNKISGERGDRSFKIFTILFQAAIVILLSVLLVKR